MSVIKIFNSGFVHSWINSMLESISQMENINASFVDCTLSNHRDNIIHLVKRLKEQWPKGSNNLFKLIMDCLCISVNKYWCRTLFAQKKSWKIRPQVLVTNLKNHPVWHFLLGYNWHIPILSNVYSFFCYIFMVNIYVIIEFYP